MTEREKSSAEEGEVTERETAPSTEGHDPFDVEEIGSTSTSVVSAVHELAHDPDSDPFAHSNRIGRTIFLFVALVVGAIGLVIVYKIATQGIGTGILADYDAGPSRADFQPEPTPPPQAPATVPTPVASTPEGAAIVVNGVATRLTAPATVDLVQDAVNVVSLHLEGHDTAFVQATGGEPVAVTLTPLPPPPAEPAADPEAAVDAAVPAEGSADPGPGAGRGRVRVIARDTAGHEVPAEVLFNGRPVGNAPVLLDVDAGVRHHVSARMAGMRDSSAYVRAIPWVDRNSEAVATLELTADTGEANRWTSVRVRTSPADAVVLVDGERRPSTGVINVDSPGHHVLEISAPDREPLVRAVDGRLGQMVIDAVLEPVRGEATALSLTVEPPETFVFIERVRHGSAGASQFATPSNATEVEAGPYRITLEHRTETERVRGRFETELQPGMHHILGYALVDGAFAETTNRTEPYQAPNR